MFYQNCATQSRLIYKKPAFWIIFAAVIICIVAAICFLRNPKLDIVMEEDIVESDIGTDEDLDETEESHLPVSAEMPVEEEPVPESDAAALFAQMPDTFHFMSGVGGWFTELYLSEDGTFTGFHCDADMGDDGVEYPNGTEYICEFTGAFSEPEKVEDYVCSIRLISLEYAPPETVTYEDDMRRITSMPFGIDGADEVLIYLPGYPVESLSDDALYWIQNAEEFWGPDDPSTLPFYVLYNVNEQTAFYSEAQ